MAENPNKGRRAAKGGAAGKSKDGMLTALKIGNGFVSLLSGLLAVMLILYSGYVLYDSFSTENRAYSSSRDLLKYKPSEIETREMSAGPEALASINEDYRAWLTVYQTGIDYPVMQGQDDLYYASHDVYRNVSLTGAIYLSAGNRRDFSHSYNLIYGHHMDSGSMFGVLDGFRDSKYFKEHQTGIIVTESGIYDITLFAVAKTDAYEDQIYKVGNRAREVISFLTGDRSHDSGIGTDVLIYDTEAAKGAMKVIALSTCADAETNGRLVVFGKLTIHPYDLPTDKPTDKPTATPTPTPTPTKKSGTIKPTATPTQTPPDVVTLTVHYLEGNNRVFPTVEFRHTPGDHYYVVSPQYPGYDVDIEIVQGTIKEDMILYVRYVPKTYRLTIRYLLADGSEIAESHTASVKTGETYEVASPAVDGYRPLKLKVSGTNPGRNEQYTVIYVPDGSEETLLTIDDYDTPTNLEITYVQAGICFE